jgi:hypothetical protein
MEVKRKMDKKEEGKTTHGNKHFLAVIIVLTLLSSIAYTALSPTAKASEVSSQRTTEILRTSVGLNMNAYTENLLPARTIPTPSTTVNLQPDSEPTPTSSFPKDDVTLSLTNAQSSVITRSSFINGRLNKLSLSYVGSPSFNQPATNDIAMAQGFLQRYQSFTGNSLYRSLSSMLDNIDPEKNVTKNAENIKLQVSIFGDQTEKDLIWTYVDKNGNPAPMKDVVLTYRNGNLESFLDNWELYQIAGVPTLSSQDAIAVALQAAQNFSYTAKDANGIDFTVSNFKVKETFNVTLGYINYVVQTPEQSLRGNDPYTLYPSWYVGVGFDKVYPGGITGLHVRVWADNGKVGSVEPMVFNTPATDKTYLSSGNEIEPATYEVAAFTILSIGAAGLIGVAALYFYSNKKKLIAIKHFRKIGFSKRKVAALCLVILPVAVMVVPSVGASALKSEIYASSYIINEWPDAQEYQYATEINAYIQMLYSQYNGVDSNNNTGPATNRNNIIENILNDKYNRNAAVVFHFGPGGPSSYIDSNGVTVSRDDIYYSTYGYTTISFVMMWTCQTANTQDFANAWTQVSGLSSNGFNSPDSTAHCYIGFQGASPTISYASFQYYAQVAGYWIEWFYYYVISGDTVHEALNDASQEVFGVPYNSSPLPSYGTYWPGGWMGDTYIPETYNYPGAMKVYGDSNMYISQGSSDYVSTPSVSSNVPNPGVALTSYQFSVSSTDSYGRNVAYKIFWGDGSSTMSSFYPSGETVYFDHSFPSGGQYTVTVSAESQYASWSNPSTYTVNLDDVYVWLTVNAYDAYLGEGYPSTTDVYVDDNYVGTVGTEPVSIQVPTGDHTVTVDYTAYNMGWGGYGTVYEITGNCYYYYNIYSYTPVTVYVFFTDDTTINAVYSMW